MKLSLSCRLALACIVSASAFPPLSMANEVSLERPKTGEEFISQQGLKQQVALAKQRLEAAQTKLTALSGCHAQNMLYVMRNGVAQCWNPVVTFPN